jgi:3-isopropylmalate dehydrogenase
MNGPAKTSKIAVIAGDGIGPEIFNQVIKIVEVLNQFGNINLKITKLPYSAEHYLVTRVAIPDEFITELVKNYDAILVGPLGDPRIPDGRHAREIIMGLRNKLDLFLAYQRVKVYAPWMCPLNNSSVKMSDFYILRENIEGSILKPGGNFYRNTADEIVTQTFLYTGKAIERLLQNVFEFLRNHGLKKIVLAHKNNVMPQLHELWLRKFEEQVARFPDISSEAVHIDALIYELLNDPDRYETICAPYEIADTLYSTGLFLQGGYGLAHVCEINPGKIGTFRILQGSAVKIAGHNRANPFGAFLAFIELLKFIEAHKLAAAVEKAVTQALQKHLVTIDMGGLIGTEEVGNYVCEFVQEQLADDQFSGADA